MSFNTKVTRHNTGVKGFSEYNQGSSGAANANYYKKHLAKQNERTVLENQSLISEKERMAEIINNTNNHRMNEGRLERVMEGIYRLGKEEVYKEVMYRLFEQCLFVDQEVKETQSAELRGLVNEYVEKNGGIATLESKMSGSKFLRDIKVVCESTAKTVSKRKVKETNAEPKLQITFDLNEDENKKLNDDISSLDSDTLEKLVKEKVVKVLEDEKARANKKAEYSKEIEDNVASAVNESIMQKIHSKDPFEQTTLWDGLMRSSYKEVLESVAIRPVVNKNKLSELGLTKSEVDYKAAEAEADPDGADWVNQADDFESMKTDLDFGPKNGDTGRVLVDDDMNGKVTQGEVDRRLEDQEYNNSSLITSMESLNMDIVLVEAITKYTLLEMCYTMKLEDYTVNDVRKLASSLIR